MKKMFLILVLALLLGGCAAEPTVSASSAEMQPPQPEPVATVPADGDPEDVTCKGSYTGQADADTVVATAGDGALTNGQLQVWYWAQVAQYRQAGHEEMPDFEKPLDTQRCTIDDSVASWQQYFLREALDAWHTAQALVNQSKVQPLPTEEAYKPVERDHDLYMAGMPATKVLYGHEDLYHPNSMHQAYLDEIPQTLADLARQKGYADGETMAREVFGTGAAEVEKMMSLQNLGYMYFTTLSYYVEPTEEELLAFYESNRERYPEEDPCVTVRHILLSGEDPEKQAEKLLKYWEKETRGHEGAFADLAYKNSLDRGSALGGGAYWRVRKGQLSKELDSWCFDPERTAGDVTTIKIGDQVHILYYSGSSTAGYLQAEEDYYRYRQQDLVSEAREAYPLEADYSAIVLTEAKPAVSAGELLYPDIAHERYPEIPLYLQQDYDKTMYGGFPLRSNGCGITSLAMLASYMADEELTPPEMCARYGRYSHYNGTDGMIFIHEPPVLGFYLREKSHDVHVVKEALQEGQIVISVQRSGYWTRGGHYIVLEAIDENDKVQVRDSNIYNYGKLKGHAIDGHSWPTVTAASSGYWIFEDKVVRIPNCVRCGDGMETEGNILTEDYHCQRCVDALLRRNTYLN